MRIDIEDVAGGRADGVVVGAAIVDCVAMGFFANNDEDAIAAEFQLEGFLETLGYTQLY